MMINDLNLNIEDCMIDRVNVFDYLGIRLDAKLTFKQHINKIIASCNYQLSHLCELRKYVDKVTALILYKVHVLSHKLWSYILL